MLFCSLGIFGTELEYFGQLEEFGLAQHFTAALLHWRFLWRTRNEPAEAHRGEKLLPGPHSLYLPITHVQTHTAVRTWRKTAHGENF